MKIGLWAVAVLVAAGTIAALGFAFNWYTAPISGKLSARKQINSGSYRIAAYEHFFQLCAAVQTDETRLAAQYVELAATSADDRSRVLANIAGITADRAEAINEYNQDARESYTIGQFKSSKLPFQLSADSYRKGTHTSCVA